MTGFRWFTPCPICKSNVRAETQLVLGKKLEEHMEKCKARASDKINKRKAASAQGSLFGK